MVNKELEKALNDLEGTFKNYINYWNEDANAEIEMCIQRGSDVWDRKSFSGHLTSVAIVFDKNMERVLLIDHNFIQKKLAPGGHCDPYEAPEDSARRELKEEVGINNVTLHEWHTGNLIPFEIDVHTVPERKKKGEPSHCHFDFRYLFVMEESSGFTLQLDEVSDAAFYPLKELRNEYPRLYKRLMNLNIIS